MLKLTRDFYICSRNQRCWSCDVLEREIDYNFLYKKIYQIELHINFKHIGFTKEDNIAIINFGYSLDVEKFSHRSLRFEYLDDVDNENGKSTKKYFNSKKAREIVLKIIEKNIDKYLKQVSPAIIIRGALSEIKLNLPRYKRFDKIFLNHNYLKQEFDVDQYQFLYKITSNYKKDKNKTIWAYAKKRWYFKNLGNVLKRV